MNCRIAADEDATRAVAAAEGKPICEAFAPFALGAASRDECPCELPRGHAGPHQCIDGGNLIRWTDLRAPRG